MRFKNTQPLPFFLQITSSEHLLLAGWNSPNCLPHLRPLFPGCHCLFSGLFLHLAGAYRHTPSQMWLLLPSFRLGLPPLRVSLVTTSFSVFQKFIENQITDGPFLISWLVLDYSFLFLYYHFNGVSGSRSHQYVFPPSPHHLQYSLFVDFFF